MYTYAWYHWITFFYLYCFFGWIFESAYVSLRKKHFVNRGFLRLPMLPLYGTGAVMMLWVSIPVKDSLILVYFSGVAAATALEYVTGWAMEQLFKVKYWDYSDQRFNLNGYICLSSSIAWGFLTILMTEFIHRPVERLVLNMNPVLEAGMLTFVTVLFVYDTVQSTRDALDLARALEAATRLRGELDDLQVQLALLRAETEQRLQELKEEQEERIHTFREEQGERMQAFREQRGERIQTFWEEQGDRIQAFREAQEERMQTFRETQEERMQNLREQRDERLCAFQEQKDEMLHAFQEQRDEMLHAFQEAQESRIRALNERLTAQSASLRQLLETHHHRILGRNPSATSRRFAAALKELRENMENHRR